MMYENITSRYLEKLGTFKKLLWTKSKIMIDDDDGGVI